MSTVQDFDASLNLLSAILWQYEQAGKLQEIVKSKQEWVERSHSEFWSDWYRDVFNVETANDFGLSIWARILNVSLGVDVPPQPAKIAFGFGENNTNFNNGNFGRSSGLTIRLDTEQKRLVIKMRYFQLTTRSTIPEINQFLSEIFGKYGGAFVYDRLDMTMTYFLKFVPTSQIRFILDSYDLLARPAGVEADWRILAESNDFGFGTENENFNNGNFGG